MVDLMSNLTKEAKLPIFNDEPVFSVKYLEFFVGMSIQSAGIPPFCQKCW